MAKDEMESLLRSKRAEYDLERVFTALEIAWAVAMLLGGSEALYGSLLRVLPPQAWGVLFLLNATIRLWCVWFMRGTPLHRLCVSALSVFVFGMMTFGFLFTRPIPGFLIYSVFSVANLIVLRRLWHRVL